MTFRKWLRSFRRPQPVTATEIRRELQALKHQQAVSVQQRDLLAHDAINDSTAEARWSHLDASARSLDDRIALLAAALPQAEAREAEAARQAEAASRAKRTQDYERRTVEAQAWLDDMLARLPTGDELTKARDLRDALSSEAIQMRGWSNAVGVRRPLDPLHSLADAMQWRLDRISRARWIGSHPITLDRKKDGTNG
jgi:hypothetical protein